MSKPSTNIAIFSRKGSIILLKIIGIVCAVYIIMAVIIHYSLHYSLEGYHFGDSLKAVFDSETAAFKFFIAYMSMNIIWIVAAFAVRLFRNFLTKRKN